MRRHELTERQWERLSPLLPPVKPVTGRPHEDHRRVLNGLLWRMKTGAPWRDIPTRYGPWPTLYSRFRRWQRAGIWARLLAALQAEADAAGSLDWDLHFVDGTVVRAHQHAAGAKKGAVIKRSAPAGAALARRFTSAATATASPSPSF